MSVLALTGAKTDSTGLVVLERLGPLHPELGSERLDGLYGLFLVLGTGDLLDGRLRSSVDTVGHRVENVSALMYPVSLRSGLGKDISDGSPESQSPVSHRELRRLHPTLFEVPQQLDPALGRLPVAVGDGHELLLTIEPGTDHHQAAQTTVASQPYSGVDAVHPHVDVVRCAEVAGHKELPLLLPVLGEAGDVSRREPGPATEELLQGRHEVPTG